MLHTERTPITGKRVQLMATCLCDAFYDDVAAATVEVLEHLGVEIAFPEAQTCCGQPAFNGGDWAASRKVVRHAVRTFAGDDPVVVPSGSCAAMMFHGAIMEFEKEPDLPEVAALGRRTWEICDYIVNGLGVKTWPGRYDAKIALHRACHTRGTNSIPAALQLLGSIQGVQLVDFGEMEQCCGFGGTFSVAFPNISASMGELKLEHVRAAQPDVYVSPDMSCLMHLSGLAQRQGKPLKGLHVAQVLRDALKGGKKD
ncbi:(Fe-S)-binding protein [Opitutus sp. ER46]|uniref:(Fe-S)-binding protein n=1 Tax=Opitutus sp. ER46 TaxID=2161864 RepID=UPI000D2FCE3C|nr:(Fe-S)-binding protein [Opitutus sp. ER46]PTX95686.1 (Fe-S)-binding protein [Opitutus sp. ER46]